MTNPIQNLAGILALHWPIQLEYWHWGYGVAFLVCVAVVLWLGMRSLAGLGPARKWVAISVRVLVLLLLFLILCGIRWTRMHTDLELLVVRDISGSTKQFTDYTGPSLDDAFKQYLKQMTERSKKPASDQIGEIVFNAASLIDVPLSSDLIS